MTLPSPTKSTNPILGEAVDSWDNVRISEETIRSQLYTHTAQKTQHTGATATGPGTKQINTGQLHGLRMQESDNAQSSTNLTKVFFNFAPVPLESHSPLRSNTTIKQFNNAELKAHHPGIFSRRKKFLSHKASCFILLAVMLAFIVIFAAIFIPVGIVKSRAMKKSQPASSVSASELLQAPNIIFPNSTVFVSPSSRASPTGDQSLTITLPQTPSTLITQPSSALTLPYQIDSSTTRKEIYTSSTPATIVTTTFDCSSSPVTRPLGAYVLLGYKKC